MYLPLTLPARIKVFCKKAIAYYLQIEKLSIILVSQFFLNLIKQ